LRNIHNRPAPFPALEFWLLSHVSASFCGIVIFRFNIMDK
jgi:hypothetical protein